MDGMQIIPTVAPMVNGKRRKRLRGELAKFMKMPMDIFFEVAKHLWPEDLLNLIRTTKHLRKVLLHKSSTGCWVAARRNKNLPDPPKTLSEPKYAALLFGTSCFICGAEGRLGEHALGIRYCLLCWQHDIEVGDVLLVEYMVKEKDRDMLELIPPIRTVEDDAGESRKKFSNTQFVEVLLQRASCTGVERQAYDAERREYVRTMLEHRGNVLRWMANKNEIEVEEYIRQTKYNIRTAEDKLYDMGYDDSDFPYHSAQFCSLLERGVLGTGTSAAMQVTLLVESIATEKKILEIKADASRRFTAQSILLEKYKAFVKSLHQDYFYPLPTCFELLDMPNLVDSHGYAMHARFDQLIGAELLAHEASFDSKVVAAVGRARRLGHRIEDGMVQVKSPLPSTANLEDLRKATFIVRCPYCKVFPELAIEAADGTLAHYGYDDLVLHIRENHIEHNVSEALLRRYKDLITADASAWDLKAAACILDMLNLRQDTLYSQVSKKVVCLCGDPEFKQPAIFSSLVDHVLDQHLRFHEEITHFSSRNDILHNDHDLSTPDKPFLSILMDGEHFSRAEIPIPPSLQLPERMDCALCYTSDADDEQISRGRSMSGETFVWHMRSKHLREPTRRDFIRCEIE